MCCVIYNSHRVSSFVLSEDQLWWHLSTAIFECHQTEIIRQTCHLNQTDVGNHSCAVHSIGKTSIHCKTVDNDMVHWTTFAFLLIHLTNCNYIVLGINDKCCWWQIDNIAELLNFIVWSSWSIKHIDTNVIVITE